MSIDFSQEESQTPLMTSALLGEDEGEGSLRPKRLSEYIGQEKAKENLSVFIDAAKMRGEPLDLRQHLHPRILRQGRRLFPYCKQ